MLRNKEADVQEEIEDGREFQRAIAEGRKDRNRRAEQHSGKARDWEFRRQWCERCLLVRGRRVLNDGGPCQFTTFHSNSNFNFLRRQDSVGQCKR